MHKNKSLKLLGGGESSNGTMDRSWEVGEEEAENYEFQASLEHGKILSQRKQSGHQDDSVSKDTCL